MTRLVVAWSIYIESLNVSLSTPQVKRFDSRHVCPVSFICSDVRLYLWLRIVQT
jgi:hypothetical protein